MHVSAQRTTVKTTFKQGDFVLFRDPEMFWTGKSGHTFVCRIDRAWTNGTYTLTALATGRTVFEVQPDYMRLLPAVDAMRDIDTAPLNKAGAVDDMTPAAIAWLTQQHATANRRAELPTQHD